MLTSIHPFGERAKGNRFGVTLAAYLLGAVLGGALLGLVAGLLGELVALALGTTTRGWLLVAASVVALGLELTGVRVPSWRRQVNEDWLTEYRGVVYGFGFGVQLGAGVLTIITSPITHLAVLAAVLVGSLPGGLLVGVCFGLAWGLGLVASRRVRSPDDLVASQRRFQERFGAARVLTRAAMAASAVVLAVGAVAA